MNINSATQRHKREDEWISRLKNPNESLILFICGFDHLKSFNALLNKRGIKSEILSEEYWGKELDPQYQITKLLKQN